MHVMTPLEEIVNKGGPEKDDYLLIDMFCDSLMKTDLNLVEEQKLYELLKPILTLDSVIGHSFLKTLWLHW